MSENSKNPNESGNHLRIDEKAAVNFVDCSKLSGESPVQISERTRALSNDVWETFFDADGRVVNESALRKAVFKGSNTFDWAAYKKNMSFMPKEDAPYNGLYGKAAPMQRGYLFQASGGIDCRIRKAVWSFLFGLYPFSSTRREREALSDENDARYQALKTRWKELVETYQPPVNPDIPESIPLYLRECQNCNAELNKPNAEGNHEQKVPLLGEDRVVFLTFTAKLHAHRQPVDMVKLLQSIRVIDKDVPRTDRGQVYFEGKGNQNLLVLRDILVTYSAYHQDVGYVQGMNDILSRFLIVLGSEAEAYWCFTNYMDTVKGDFLDDGMLNKIKHVRLLLRKMDEHLYNHFEAHDMGDMLFVHRWLVLTFKREFPFEDALTMFEIISSQHLELSSMEAERERERQRAKELERDEGEFHVQMVDMNTNYSFEVFVCLAVLKEYKNELLKSSEISSVYNTIHSLSMKMDVNIILMRAEELFFKYCRKSVEECFQVVDFEKIS